VAGVNETRGLARCSNCARYISDFCCYLFTRYPWNGNELYDLGHHTLFGEIAA